MQFSGLESATKLGNHFLTYVLWGSVPQGQTLNIGDLTLTGDRGRVVATTVLRNFAMMVTAEPYAVVTQPSSIVILKGASPTTGSAKLERKLPKDLLEVATSVGNASEVWRGWTG